MKKKPSVPRFRVHTGGVTFIELVVIAAILGVLASIAAPLLSNIRTNSLRAQTANHLREVYAATGLFANDPGFRSPAAVTSSERKWSITSWAPETSAAWWEMLVDGGYLGNADKGINQPGFYSVLGSPIQWRESPEATVNRNPMALNTFAMNSFLFSGGAQGDAPFVRKEELLSPGKTLFISEGHLNVQKNRFDPSVSPARLPNKTEGIITLIYADGQVGQFTVDEFPADFGPKGSDNWFFWKGY